MATRAPSAASRRAMAAPIEREPPVTRADLPARGRLLFLLSMFCSRQGCVVGGANGGFSIASSVVENRWNLFQAIVEGGAQMETLANLESFVRSAQARSFSAAARRLGLTPAAVSRNVATLERNVGQRLFQRSTRQLTLTEAG